jgi:hypothetical protein
MSFVVHPLNDAPDSTFGLRSITVRNPMLPPVTVTA